MENVSHEMTMDHFTLLCSLDLRIPDPPVQSSFRNIKCIDRHQLTSEINLKLTSIVHLMINSITACKHYSTSTHHQF